MSSTKHKKHADLTRPGYGQFHHNEWAIIGTPCGKIKDLAFDLIERLSDQFRFGYVDADHQSVDKLESDGRTVMARSARLVYTDKISHHRFDFKAEMDKFQYRWWFNEQDAVLVNGNHFRADRQIVVIDPEKEASLKKKLDRLTDVALILLSDGISEIYPFLRAHLKNVANIPVMRVDDRPRIAEWLQEQMAKTRPPLYGLVLAGGKSQRMGRDKGLIDYHGKPQREYAADLLTHFCEKTFLSCRPEQLPGMDSEYPALVDTFMELGPFGAILSAFREYPDHAWLVVATDLPLIDKTTLAQLAAKRNVSKMATAFQSPANEFPEPLITIWEPRSYPVLLQFLAQGYSCPRKALINSEVELVEAANPDALKNVNHPEELVVIMQHLAER
jgi:molybdopterin-guanine dinucleotide biosynthesis protein A